VTAVQQGTAIACLFVQKHTDLSAHAASRLACSCIVPRRQICRRILMSLSDVTRGEHAVEECLDELNDFLAGLQRYPPTVLAVALRVHLAALLHALVDGRLSSREEVRELVRELERDALQYEEGN
jgi:hypothetical protein